MQSIDCALQFVGCSRDMQRFPLPDIKVGAGIVTKAEGILCVQEWREFYGITTGPRKFRRHRLYTVAEPWLQSVVSSVIDDHESPHPSLV